MRPLIAAALVVTACRSPPRVAEPVAAVNALVPADLRGVLRFEQRTITVGGHRLTFPAPAGWSADERGNMVRPDEPKHDGAPYFPAAMTVRAGACAGDWTGEACTDAPAAAQVNALFEPMKDDKVLEQQTTATERTLEAQEQFASYAVRAWWQPGASRFTYCVGTLTTPLQPAVKAFAAACRAVHEQ